MGLMSARHQSELLSSCLGETFNPGSLSAGINLSLLKPWFLTHQQSQAFALGQSLPQCERENLVWKCIQNQAERIFYLLMMKYTSARGSELVRLVLLCVSDRDAGAKRGSTAEDAPFSPSGPSWCRLPSNTSFPLYFSPFSAQRKQKASCAQCEGVSSQPRDCVKREKLLGFTFR